MKVSDMIRQKYIDALNGYQKTLQELLALESNRQIVQQYIDGFIAQCDAWRTQAYKLLLNSNNDYAVGFVKQAKELGGFTEDIIYSDSFWYGFEQLKHILPPDCPVEYVMRTSVFDSLLSSPENALGEYTPLDYYDRRPDKQEQRISAISFVVASTFEKLPIAIPDAYTGLMRLCNYHYKQNDTDWIVSFGDSVCLDMGLLVAHLKARSCNPPPPKGKVGTPKTWTPQSEKRAKELWQQGKTYREVAEIITKEFKIMRTFKAIQGLKDRGRWKR